MAVAPKLVAHGIISNYISIIISHTFIDTNHSRYPSRSWGAVAALKLSQPFVGCRCSSRDGLEERPQGFLQRLGLRVDVPCGSTAATKRCHKHLVKKTKVWPKELSLGTFRLRVRKAPVAFQAEEQRSGQQIGDKRQAAESRWE